VQPSKVLPLTHVEIIFPNFSEYSTIAMLSLNKHTGGTPDDAFARYGFVEGIVVLKPCQTGKIDRDLYPASFPFCCWHFCLYSNHWGVY
jgi:hypothetical protein